MGRAGNSRHTVHAKSRGSKMGAGASALGHGEGGIRSAHVIALFPRGDLNVRGSHGDGRVMAREPPRLIDVLSKGTESGRWMWMLVIRETVAGTAEGTWLWRLISRGGWLADCAVQCSAVLGSSRSSVGRWYLVPVLSSLFQPQAFGVNQLESQQW